jgi:hypothetical protein
MKEALDMVAHKIGRILNGDPTYTDSWHDIAGYSKLVEDELSAAPTNEAITGLIETAANVKPNVPKLIAARDALDAAPVPAEKSVLVVEAPAAEAPAPEAPAAPAVIRVSPVAPAPKAPAK